MSSSFLVCCASCQCASAALVTGINGAGDAVRMSKLFIVGSCRNADDDARLQQLQALAEDLGLAQRVEWHVDVPYSDLKLLLGGAVGGIHTMVDEHFGISVVEYMAAGVVPIAHNSGAQPMYSDRFVWHSILAPIIYNLLVAPAHLRCMRAFEVSESSKHC